MSSCREIHKHGHLQPTVSSLLRSAGGPDCGEAARNGNGAPELRPAGEGLLVVLLKMEMKKEMMKEQ